MTTRTLPRGMYCPVPCFFKPNEDLDLITFAHHVVHISKAGCFPLISGTLGEASLLDAQDRRDLIRTARKALDDAGLSDVAILAGAGAPSTLESTKNCYDAAEAGADAVLIVPSGYYGGILKQNTHLLEQHFVDIAESSPVPVMIYDSVYVTGGIDLSHELIANLARRSGNTCGVKLTCPSLGKLTRLSEPIHSQTFQSAHPRKQKTAPFLLLTGLIDNVLAAASIGADGCIGGPPNFAPYTSAKLWRLSQLPLSGENLKEAQRLQSILARADAAAFDAGVPALKWLLGDMYGCSKAPRRPLPTLTDAAGEAFKAALEEVLQTERELQGLSNLS